MDIFTGILRTVFKERFKSIDDADKIIRTLRVDEQDKVHIAIESASYVGTWFGLITGVVCLGVFMLGLICFGGW